jgi:hypothetical protein
MDVDGIGSVAMSDRLWRKSHLLRSRPLYNRGESGGLGGNWLDGTAGQRFGENPVDEYCHLAKVRVAGSNPVFRSKMWRMSWGNVELVDLARHELGIRRPSPGTARRI